MAWSREVAQALLLDEAFVSLFEDAESPVRQEIDRLTKIGLDPRADRENRERAIAMLAGMKRVHELTIRAANESQEVANEERQPVRRRRGYPFPPLTGLVSPPSPESTGTDGQERSRKWTTYFR